ncbi:MAG: M55 family metallopeptidase, partial [Candidatus Eisenbacteria bacterium]|nr:M55 family metallopeptidase [Candidatus Eisenbacteria bacterium]
MRVFLSVDIEGISGVATWDQARTDGPDHAHARRWMVEDVNAAVRGAMEGGAGEVLVRDAHGRARNVLFDSLHPQARLVSGWDPKVDMLLGLEAGFGTVFLIGYHPGPSVARGVLSHAFTTRILEMRLNGLPCNEAVFAALQAGTLGVPVGLVTGQEELREEIRPALGDVPFVSTKRGLAVQAAILEPRDATHERIEAASKEAVRVAATGGGPPPFRPDPPLALSICLLYTSP